MKKILRTDFKQIFVIIISFLLLWVVVYSFAFFGIKDAVYTFIVFSSLSILFLYSKKQKKHEGLITNIFWGILFFFILKILYRLFLTYFTIPVWDFLCFYLFGKVGISGLPFYDPNVFSEIFNLLNLPLNGNGGFITEIVNVGFWYPPPSMFLFLPLGLFNLNTAHIIWQTVLIFFFIINIIMLLRYYKHAEGYDTNISYLFLISLILFFPGLISSVQIGQTVFIFLFLLLLLLKNLNNWKAGIFLSLLIIIKPLAAAFVLYFLIFKKWKVFISFVATGFIVIGVSIMFFGMDPFLVFFKSPPTSRIPSEVFYEPTIQSLSAVLLRLQVYFFGFVEFKTIKVIAYSLSLIIIIVTTYCSLLLSKKDNKLAFMIFVPMALLIYPNTLVSYTIILLPIILYFFSKNFFNNDAMNLLVIFFLYGICHYSFFLFNFILWILFIAMSRENGYNLFLKINSRFKILQSINGL